MADRWMYKQGGAIKGPITHEQIAQLVHSGQLAPTDRVWAEGNDPRHSVEAQSVLAFVAQRQPTELGDDWAGKVAQSLTPAVPAAGTTPDWVTSIQPPPAAQVAKPVPANLPVALPIGPPVAVPVARPSPYPPRLLVAGASSRGKVRERNEDRFLTQQWGWNDADGMHEIGLLIVADGMGGYHGGDVAAVLTVGTVATSLAHCVVAGIGGKKMEPPTIAAALVQAIRAANGVVLQHASADARFKDMGATVAVALIWDGHAYFSHAGDCRVYLHRRGKLEQLTQDQTLVARMVALGQLTPDEAARHPSANEVTQAVGKRAGIEPSQGARPLERGDTLLLACDGLAAHVEQTALQQTLNTPAFPPQHLAAHLVQMADTGGGSDNCTVVVAGYS